MKKPFDPKADYQPQTFSFKDDGAVHAVIARYPNERQASAVMPLLWMAQREHKGWIPKAAMDEIARILDMSPARVYEVASFYTMYNLAPIGKYHIQCCGTTPCWLRGAQAVQKACEEAAATAPRDLFTISEVECLGACTAAPVIQVNEDTYENMTPSSVRELMTLLAAGVDPKGKGA